MKVRRGRYRSRANRLRSNFKKFSSWGAILLLSTAWLVVPLGAAGALEVAIGEPIVGPTPLEPPIPLPEDPVQEVVDTVNGIINPPPEEQPPPSEDTGSDTSQGGEGGSTSDQASGGTVATTESGSTATDVVGARSDLPTATTGPSVPGPAAGATSLSPAVGSAAFPDYENAKGTLGPFEYANANRSSVGPRSTLEILAILEDINLPTERMARILAPFPVAGPATYTDDWGQPRSNPSPHPHQGTDIFAERGTPVIASANGVATDVTSFSEVGGTSLKVKTRDDTYYYYAHLDQLSPFVFEGKSLTKGEIIGYVGTSGNAEGGLPHLHYEIHPYGGPAVPPVPYLDRWLSEALQAAQALKASTVQGTFLNRLAKAGAAVARVAEAAVLEPLQKVANISTATGWGSVAGAIVIWRLLNRRRRREPAPSWLDVSGP